MFDKLKRARIRFENGATLVETLTVVAIFAVVLSLSLSVTSYLDQQIQAQLFKTELIELRAELQRWNVDSKACACHLNPTLNTLTPNLEFASTGTNVDLGPFGRLVNGCPGGSGPEVLRLGAFGSQIEVSSIAFRVTLPGLDADTFLGKWVIRVARRGTIEPDPIDIEMPVYVRTDPASAASAKSIGACGQSNYDFGSIPGVLCGWNSGTGEVIGCEDSDPAVRCPPGLVRRQIDTGSGSVWTCFSP